MKKGMWLAVLGLAAAAGPAAAQNEPRGIYLGGSAGYSVYQSTCEISNVPCDDDSTAAKGFAGYRWNKHWAAEVAAGVLGKAKGSGDLPAGGTGSFEEKSYGADLSALGSVPIVGRLSAFGRLGVYLARTTVDQESSLFGSEHDAKTQGGFTYGLGLQYDLGFLGVRAEWQRYDNIGAPSILKDDLDIYMLGVLVQF